jgi:hypothetical protein
MTDSWRGIINQLDIAPDGKAFGAALNNLFSALETAREKQEAEVPAEPDDIPPHCPQCGSDASG